ncbi:MAG TPA: hypothetical protein VID74_09365 [Gemmatimonadales bacterium]
MRGRNIWLIALAACLPAAPAGASQITQSVRVETVMRHVDFHIDSTLIMHIEYLRGRLVGQRAGQPPWFDDRLSFDIEMDTASITLSTGGLADLLNRYVFNYHGSPLRGIKVSVDQGRLKQSGRLHGMPFSIVTEASVTPGGELRLHPASIHAFGVGVQGLMHLFGLSLQKMADVAKAPGVRIERNDLLLTPSVMLPPPSTRGKLVAVSLRDSALTLRFGGRGPVRPLEVPDRHATNFMYFRGPSIRFWTLTMTPADLLVVDADPRDPFDFWLARYRTQLVAGSSRNTPSGGLITQWPDLNKVRGKR